MIILLAVLVSIGYVASLEKLNPETQHATIGKRVTYLLPKYHYTHKVVDDRISAKLLELYIKALDPNRSYFLASDIKAFSKFRHQLDEALKDGELEPAFSIFNIFKQRVYQRIEFINRRLKEDFDFAIDEYYQMNRKDTSWPKGELELNEVWRKRLKNEALELKLNDKSKSDIDSILIKRYHNFERRIDEYNSEDVFQLFLTALSQSYDPHSSYLSPITSDNFGIQMTLSFQGIGASLVQEDVYTKVHSIIPGGPADRSKQLKANDKIIGVAQGEEGEMVDVVGMRLDDVVQKIRGKKGTVVRLQIIPADVGLNGPTKIISLVRDKIVLKEREAKSDTIKLEHEGQEYTIGVISIPTFYADYKAQSAHPSDYKSTSHDVRRLIEDLKSAGIDGLIIDLRNNGGGFLQEAINLTGLFIEKGPVVQVKKTNGKIEIAQDIDVSIAYDGPLAVLVNRLSASASEIFAAAIQDYDRGIVLGTQTFGKGTVQTLLNLGSFKTGPQKKPAQLKITISKFYRIAGGTTQHQGVIPDIIFPSVHAEMDIGENNEENALPWDQIRPIKFENQGRVAAFLTQLSKKSKQRTELNPEFRYIIEDIGIFKHKKERNLFSLNETIRKKEREQQDQRRLERLNQRRIAMGLKPLKKDEKDDNEISRPDALLDETERVLADFIQLTAASNAESVVKTGDRKKETNSKSVVKVDDKGKQR